MKLVKQSHFVVVTLVLVLLNLGVIGYVVFFMNLPQNQPNTHRPRPPHQHEGPKFIIIEALEFTPSQVEQYEELIQQHRTAIRTAEQNLMEFRSALYASLNEQKTPNDSLLKQIAELNLQIEKIHYNHFTQIQALCTPQQQELFKAFATDLAKLFNTKAPPLHAAPRH